MLEASTVGAGASGRNGGMVSAGFAAPMRLLERAAGRDSARTLMRLSREAMDLIRARVERYAIPCEPVSGVVIASWFDDSKALAAEVAEYNADYGMRLEFWPKERLRRDFPSPRYWDGMFDPEGFHLDPFALCRGYADAAERQGARLFEHSPATTVRRAGGRWRVATPKGEVSAERLVLCQSAYPPRLLPALARATLPVFTYIIVTAPLTGAHAEVIRAPYAVYDNRFATGYYRLLPDGRLLWGGRISTAGTAQGSGRADAARSRAGLPAAGGRRGRARLVGADGLRAAQDAADPRAGAGPVGQQLLRRPRAQHHHAGRRAGGLGPAGG